MPLDPTLRQLFSPYWTLAPGHESTIILHNNLVNAPLSVRPVLLSPDGVRIELPEIVLLPLETADVDLRQVFTRNSTFLSDSGSAILEYKSSNGALSAETSVSDRSNTLAYTITAFERGATKNQLSSVFWFPPGGNGEAYVVYHIRKR